jgi:hypothetical protein
MSIRNYTVTAEDSLNRGKIGGKHLAIDTAGNITATLTANGSLLLQSYGSGAVDSVNGQVGDVILDASDINETLTRVYVTPAEKTQITTNQNDISTLQTTVEAIQVDGAVNIGIIFTDIGILQTDVTTLQTDVGTLQTDVGTLQTEHLLIYLSGKHQNETNLIGLK